MAGRTREVKSDAVQHVGVPGGPLRRRAVVSQPSTAAVPTIVRNVLSSPGQPLDSATRAYMEPRLGRDFARIPARSISPSAPARLAVGPVHDPMEREADAAAERVTAQVTAPAGERFDLGHVRVHTGPQADASAQALDAHAYTVGNHVVFGRGQYAPDTSAGRNLLAHELAHVAQRDGAEPVVRRRVQMRDVGHGEQSGFARLPELIDRLNAMSPSLVFSMNGSDLTYTQNPGTTPTQFERRMMALIGDKAVLPLRLTNRHGLLGDHTAGFHTRIAVDDYDSGYVDIDDLLAADDLVLQMELGHFLTERAATARYAQRIGNRFPDNEFDVGHARGIVAERDVLRDYFGDPTIHFVNEPRTPGIRRVFRNHRGDTIRWRVTQGAGVEAGVEFSAIEVITKDKRRLTAEEYRELLATERQISRERLGGATEQGEGTGGVPAP